MEYLQATHTGKGFYTHNDRKIMPRFEIIGSVIVVDGNSAEWKTRVGATSLSKAEAEIIIENEWIIGLEKEKAEYTKLLKDAEKAIFDITKYNL